jgi:hypothetical protein
MSSIESEHLTDQQEEEKFPSRPVARVFFAYDGEHVSEMRGLPLSNHLGNVATLARLFDFEAAFGSRQCPSELEQTRFWLTEAARRHDEGKVHRFILRRDDQGHFTYSFSGHRFLVEDDRLYVQWLIRLHHGFSVADVTEAQAHLKRASDPKLQTVAKAFPLDLYALEMCDQIEAEAATHAFGQPDSHRVFMEFEVIDIATPKPDCVRLYLFPYPFAEPEVHFSMESFVVSVPPPPAVAQEGNALKRWLLREGPVVRTETKEIQLCKAE